MTKSLYVLCLCLGLGLQSLHAAPIQEDEPLPFDTHMPPPRVEPADDAPARRASRTSSQVDSEEPRAAQRCKTVTKKVKGRKVKKQVCTKTASSKTSKASGKSAKRSSRAASKASTSKSARAKKASNKKSAAKSRSRRR